jgi:hypothetical protein
VLNWCDCGDLGDVVWIMEAELAVTEASLMVREDSLFSLSERNDLLDFCLEKARPMILLSCDCLLP